jgi:parvulin-like peptidyl-prolyl isomerase
LAVLVAWTLGGGLVGCQTPTERDVETVLATFDGGEVTLGELQRWLEREAVGRDGGRIRRREAREAVIEEIAAREILARAQPGDDPLAEAATLAAIESVYEAAMRERLGWSSLTLSDAEARRYYDDHVAQFARPERLRLQHVFLRAEAIGPGAEQREAARERIEALRREAVKGADFAALAREHSDSADGPAGGWMALERGMPAVEEFTDVVWALASDEISPVIETPVGFHIARVAARIAAYERPFEEVRGRVYEEARAARLRELEAEYVERVAPQHDVQRHYELLGTAAATGDTLLFSVADDGFVVSDLLSSLPDTYRAQFYAGYLPQVEDLLEREVLRRLLVRQALEEGLPREDGVQAEVEAAIARVRGDAELERRLGQRRSAIDTAVLRRHYDRAPERYRTARRRSISLIRLAPEGAESLWSLLRRGEELVEALREGADFAAAARRESKDPSAVDGGRLTDLTDDELAVRVPSRSRGRRILDELELGEISPAFIGEVYDHDALRMVPTGVYVVRLDEERRSSRLSFEEAEELVRVDYARRAGEPARDELKREILAAAGFRLIEGRASRSTP